LTKTLSHYHDAFNNQLQLQLQKSTKSSPRSNTFHSPRCPAGELDIDMEDQASGSIDPLDALDQSPDEQSQSPDADDVELQLNQQLQALFLSQQVAMTALSAGQQPLATPTPTHNVLCLCSKCVKNLPN